MCIASFVFKEHHTIITFNRDENKSRIAEFPSWHTQNNDTFFCPIDTEGKGTWIGYNGKIIATLQNGAFIKHKRTPPYSKSRGIIIKEILATTTIAPFLNLDYLQNVEPFTLSVFNVENRKITIYRFDGKEIFIEEKPHNESFILCSCTLYNANAYEKIQENFNQLDTENALDYLHFHQQHAIGTAANTFTTFADTVSITQFEIQHSIGKNIKVNCTYLDLVSHKEKKYTL